MKISPGNLEWAKGILRIGLAFTFIYAAISAILAPGNWIGFIPLLLRDALPENAVLYGHIAFNIFIGVWLVANKKIFYASILASLSLLIIIISNLHSLDIVFRDVGLLAAAISLALLNKR